MKLFKILLAIVVVFAGMTSCEESTDVGKIGVKEISESGSDVIKTTAQKTQEKAEKKAQDVADNPSANLPKTGVAFAEYEHYFGVIDEGDSVEHIFKFTNQGKEDLILEKCKGSCGCTVPTCPKEPIPPGGEGEIKVVFNSKGKKNKQSKKVTITANTDPIQTVLTISADVTPAEPEAAK